MAESNARGLANTTPFVVRRIAKMLGFAVGGNLIVLLQPKQSLDEGFRLIRGFAVTVKGHS